MDRNLVDQVVGAAARVVASGAISANGHGNVSLRVPGADEMYFTSAPSLEGWRRTASSASASTDAARGHAAARSRGRSWPCTPRMYQDRPDVGCVIHTHSPYATAFAVANRPIGCWIEALAMFGLPDGVPVAAYGPRGSEDAVANIRRGRPTRRPRRPPREPRGARLPPDSGPGGAWSAGSSRKPRRRRSTRSRSAARSRSRTTCARPRSSGRWRSTPRGRRPPEAAAQPPSRRSGRVHARGPELAGVPANALVASPKENR